MAKLFFKKTRLPQVMIPYPGPCADDETQDVFLYLRPETNGVLIESLLLRIVKNEKYAAHCKVIYLANMPGDYIVRKRIIEQHYALKIKFAHLGKVAFTPFMIKKFENYFLENFFTAKIIGAYEAIHKLKIDPEELFKLWVPPHHFAIINGQTIKYYNGYYILNYDIPALLHKNSRQTDFAVMIFRSSLSRTDFHYLVEDMRSALIAEQILGPERPLSRTFHYSSGPFEQILDGIGYLYNPKGKHLPLDQISFYNYLLRNGISRRAIQRAIRNPIMRFKTEDGIIEENIFQYTASATYQEALDKFRQRISA